MCIIIAELAAYCCPRDGHGKFLLSTSWRIGGDIAISTLFNNSKNIQYIGLLFCMKLILTLKFIKKQQQKWVSYFDFDLSGVSNLLLSTGWR